jgi:hypothetical protein
MVVRRVSPLRAAGIPTTACHIRGAHRSNAPYLHWADSRFMGRIQLLAHVPCGYQEPGRGVCGRAAARRAAVREGGPWDVKKHTLNGLTGVVSGMDSKLKGTMGLQI